MSNDGNTAKKCNTTKSRRTHGIGFITAKRWDSWHLPVRGERLKTVGSLPCALSVRHTTKISLCRVYFPVYTAKHFFSSLPSVN
jgi:hypothetical protein